MILVASASIHQIIPPSSQLSFCDFSLVVCARLLALPLRMDYGLAH